MVYWQDQKQATKENIERKMARTAEELEVSQWDIYYLLDCMSVRKKKILKK